MAKILVVDDSDHVRDSLKEALEKAGHKATLAVNGEEGLTAYDKDSDFDLIITDLNMPVMDGMQMCETLHTKYPSPKPPILILSSEADPVLKNQSKEYGVVGWIVKPCKETVISSVVEKIIKKFKKA